MKFCFEIFVDHFHQKSSIDHLPGYTSLFHDGSHKCSDENRFCCILVKLTQIVLKTYVQVCCICLAKYANNDELRELPCSHFFHKDCVDKWLKINALCPLCKTEVGESIIGSLEGTNRQQQGD